MMLMHHSRECVKEMKIKSASLGCGHTGCRYDLTTVLFSSE